jgi:hypothetical protein
MAICLTVTSDQVTLVHASDPDVTLPESCTDRGWVAVGVAQEVRGGATKVTVRPLNGREMLSCYGGASRADQLFAMCQAGVVTIDGSKPADDALLALDWVALSGLGSFIETLSTGFTKPPRS